MLKATDSLKNVSGVGPALHAELLKAGLSTVEDLIYYFPRKWEDLSHLTPIVSLVEGEKTTLKATLLETKTFRSPYKKMTVTQGRVSDDTGTLDVVWFNQPYLKTSLKVGEEYYLTGVARSNRGSLQLTSPTIEPADKTPLHSGKIVPIYPETRKLTTKLLRRMVKNALPVIREMPDFLPSNILSGHDFMHLHTALEAIHFPVDENNLQAAKDRLSFDELFITQLSVQYLRANYPLAPAKPIPMDVELIKNILAQLPFTLTPSQKQALHEILKDFEKPTATNRILMGDVGSGKTIVVAIAAMEMARAGLQSALMVPTEVLAKQHYQTLKELLKPFDVSLALKTRLEDVGEINSDIVIGTHALFQEKVEFPRLGLVIVDEQHRFGVKQREALKAKGASPHFLTLTATPIPRSLALTLFGHLDISVIKTKPVGRLPITTQALGPHQKAVAYKKVAEELALGHQAFVIAPLIETSASITTQSVTQLFSEIQKRFPKKRIGLLHGQLDAATKSQSMSDFKAGKIDILVATTVIEVGIDIPNATVMVVEGAERFGLAQLHQLRGRVGRSNLQSFCFVIPEDDNPEVMERLQLFAQTLDGFKLAEIDLQMRGPGALFGYAQTGFLKYRLANWTDTKALNVALKAAQDLIAKDPKLSQYPALAEKIDIDEMTLHRE